MRTDIDGQLFEATLQQREEDFAFYREFDNLKTRRPPPSPEVIDRWLTVRPRTGRIEWRRDVPPPLWRTNPGKRTFTVKRGQSAPVFWRPSVAGQRTHDGKQVRKPQGCWMIFIPNERWVRASDVIWLKSYGQYPEGSISPRNGDHSDLRVCNWVAHDVVRRAHNEPLKKHHEAIRRAEIVEARAQGRRVPGFSTKQKWKPREQRAEQDHNDITTRIQRITRR
jgi:hypothetical protein